MNIKILMLIGWYFPDSIGGSEYYVHMLSNELVKLGYDVVIAAPTSDKKPKKYIYKGNQVYRYPVSVNPTKKELRGEVNPTYFDEFQKIFSEINPKIVHIHSLTRGCGFYHARYVKEMGLPLIFTVHMAEVTCVRGTMMLWGEVPCDGEMQVQRCTACFYNKNGIPKFLSKTISNIPPFLKKGLFSKNYVSSRINSVNELMNMTDSIVVVCNWLKEVLTNNNVDSDKIKLIKHALPSDIIKKGKLVQKVVTPPTVIAYIGRIIRIKGIDILIKSFKQLTKFNNTELHIHGMPRTNEEIEYFNYLKKISLLDNRIKFCGKFGEEERDNIMKSIDILAVPSVCFETGPLVVLEAFAYGIPVIGSNIGGIAELIEDGKNGILAKWGDVNSWTDKMEELLQSRDLMNVNNNFDSYYDMGRDMNKIYRKLLSL